MYHPQVSHNKTTTSPSVLRGWSFGLPGRWVAGWSRAKCPRVVDTEMKRSRTTLRKDQPTSLFRPTGLNGNKVEEDRPCRSVPSGTTGYGTNRLTFTGPGNGRLRGNLLELCRRDALSSHTVVPIKRSRRNTGVNRRREPSWVFRLSFGFSLSQWTPVRNQDSEVRD